MALAQFACEMIFSPNSEGHFFNCFEKVQKVDVDFPLCPDTAQAVWSGGDAAPQRPARIFENAPGKT